MKDYERLSKEHFNRQASIYDKKDTMKMKIMTNREIKTKEQYNNIITTLYNKVYGPRLESIYKWKD